jgi:hypothetical protein
MKWQSINRQEDIPENAVRIGNFLFCRARGHGETKPTFINGNNVEFPHGNIRILLPLSSCDILTLEPWERIDLTHNYTSFQESGFKNYMDYQPIAWDEIDPKAGFLNNGTGEFAHGNVRVLSNRFSYLKLIGPTKVIFNDFKFNFDGIEPSDVIIGEIDTDNQTNSPSEDLLTVQQEIESYTEFRSIAWDYKETKVDVEVNVKLPIWNAGIRVSDHQQSFRYEEHRKYNRRTTSTLSSMKFNTPPRTRILAQMIVTTGTGDIPYTAHRKVFMGNDVVDDRDVNGVIHVSLFSSARKVLKEI